MKVEANVKQELIVDAAIRRFSHFGIAKTTLTEVAEDMAVSKQALSYYFADKQSLANAVIEKITIEYGDRLRTEMGKAATVEAALLKLTEVKGFFFEKYFMLVMQAEYLDIVKGQAYSSWKKSLADKELGLITELFEGGMRTGELKVLDAKKTGELFLETLYAFSRCVKEKGAFPDADAFKEVLEKQKEVIQLFYQGLKENRLN